MSLDHQFLTVGLMMGCGLGLGACFDIYRVLASKLNLKSWFIAILDVIYGLLSAIAVFRVLYYSNDGQLRIFIFFALMLGIYLYYQWFSSTVVRVVVRIISGIEWVWNVFIMKPIELFFKVLWIFFGFFRALTVFFYKLMLQLTYPLQFLTRRFVSLIQRLFHLS